MASASQQNKEPENQQVSAPQCFFLSSGAPVGWTINQTNQTLTIQL